MAIALDKEAAAASARQRAVAKQRLAREKGLTFRW
jgi:hypothetical protein